MSTSDRVSTTDWRRTRQDVVRAFNKRVLNPAMMLVAGRRYWYAGVIQHVGRRSGKNYSTPVVADRTSDGFIIPLPYGTEVDWLRNVLATGKATIQVRGTTYPVTAPKVIDAEAAFPLVPAGHARTWRLLGIGHYLKVIDRTEQS